MAQSNPSVHSHQDIHPEFYLDSHSLEEKTMRADFARVMRLRESVHFALDDTQASRLSARATQIENQWTGGSSAHDWDRLAYAFGQWTWTPESEYRYQDRVPDFHMRLAPVERRSESQAEALAGALADDRWHQRPSLTEEELKTALAQGSSTEQLTVRVPADIAVSGTDVAGLINAAGLDGIGHSDMGLGIDTDSAIGDVGGPKLPEVGLS